MKKKDFVLLIVPSATEAEAGTIGDIILDGRHATCVNLFQGVSSAYWWQGHVDSGEECLLSAKSKISRFDKLTEVVQRHRSYRVPEIVAISMIGGNADYLDCTDGEASE